MDIKQGGPSNRHLRSAEDGNVVTLPGRRGRDGVKIPEGLRREACALYGLAAECEIEGITNLFDQHILCTIEDLGGRLGRGDLSKAKSLDLCDYVVGWLHLLIGEVLDMAKISTVDDDDAARLFALSACPIHRERALAFAGSPQSLRAIVEGGAARREDLERLQRFGFRVLSGISRERLPDLDAVWRSGDVRENSFSRIFAGADSAAQLDYDRVEGRYTGDAVAWIELAMRQNRDPLLILAGGEAHLQMSLDRIVCDDEWLNPSLGYAAWRDVADELMRRGRALRTAPQVAAVVIADRERMS